MLEFIRKHANSTTFKIFLAVLASTFVFCFGIFDIINRWMGRDYIVKIGNIKITPVMFSMEKAKKLNMLRSHEKDFDEKAMTNSILHQVIWENIVDQAASEFGFIVSEDTIKKYIAGMGLFRDKEGRFNSGMLRNFLHNINVSEAMFVEFSGKDIKNALIKAPFKYVSPHKSLDRFIKSNLEKRTVSFVEINPDSINISDKPTQNELEDFYSEHQDLFLVAETRNFSVVELLEDDISKNISVSEEEIRDFYETSPDREDRTYDEMKDEIKAEITQNKLQSEIDDKTRQIEDALMAGENFDEVVKKFNLNVTRINGATALGKGGKTNSSVQTKYRDDILTVAFSTDEGSDSSFSEAINEKGKRVLWLVHVDSVMPKHVANFADVSEKITKEWKKSKQHKKAVELAESFCNGTKEGKALELIASQNKRKIFATKPFDRSGNLEQDEKSKKDKNDKTPQEERMASVASEFAEQAFSGEKGSAFYKEIGQTIVVAQIERIIPAGNVNSEVFAKCHVELVRDMSDDLYQQLVGYLSREKYEITINHEMLEKTGTDSSRIDEIF